MSMRQRAAGYYTKARARAGTYYRSARDYGGRAYGYAKRRQNGIRINLRKEWIAGAAVSYALPLAGKQGTDLQPMLDKAALVCAVMPVSGLGEVVGVAKGYLAGRFAQQYTGNPLVSSGSSTASGARVI